jgi:hypothetical protein
VGGERESSLADPHGGLAATDYQMIIITVFFTRFYVSIDNMASFNRETFKSSFSKDQVITRIARLKIGLES